MAEDVGELVVRVAMENSSFQQGVQNLNRELKVIQSEFKNATAGLADHGKGLDGLKAKSDMLSKSLDVQSKIVKAYEDKLKESQSTLDSNAKKHIELTDAVNKAERAYKESEKTLGKNAQETQQLKSEYEKLQAEFGKSEEKIRNNARAIDNWSIKTNNAKARLSELQSEFSKTNRAIETQNSTWNKISTRMNEVGNKFNAVGEKIGNVGSKISTHMSVPLTGLGVAAAKFGIDFETAMSQAAGALDKPVSQMGDLRELALKTGQDTQFSAKEAANAITELAKGGLTEAQIKGGALKATMDLAASSSMELGVSANTVVQAMGAFGLSADKSAQAVNALAGAAAASSTDVEPLSQGLAQCAAQAHMVGWSIQDTTAILGEFADAGVVGSDAGTSLKTMLQRLGAPTDEAAVKMEALKINVWDSNNHMKDASGIAQELQTKFSGLSDSEKQAAMQTIFGSDATRAANIIMNNGAEGLKKYTKATNDQSAASRLAASQMGETQRSLEEMKGSLETAGIKIGEALAPHIKKIADFLGNLADKFANLSPFTQKFILILAGITIGIGPVLIAISNFILAIGSISLAFGKLASFLAEKQIATKIAQVFKIPTIPPNLFNSFILGLQTLGSKISAFLVGPWKLLGNGFKALPGLIKSISLTSLVTKITTPFKQIPTLLKGVFAKLPALLNGVKTLFVTFGSTIIGLGPKILAAIRSAFSIQGIMTAARGALALFTGPWGALALGIATVVGGIIANWDKIKEWVQQHFGGTLPQNFEQFSQMFQNIWTTIQQVFSNVWESIKQVAIDTWNYIGPTIMSGVTSVQSFWNEVWPQIKQVFVEVWNVMKIILGPAVAALYTIISAGIGLIKGIWGPAWNVIKDTLKIVWDGITGVIRIAWDIISGVIKVGLDLLTGNWSKAWEDMKTIFSNLWNDIKSLFSNMAKDAVTWGKDMVQGLINGIKGMIGSAADAASNVASTIRSYLHFTVPDVGPLSDADTYGGDFMELLANTINENSNKPEEAAKKVADLVAQKIKSVKDMLAKDTKDLNSELYNIGQQEERALRGVKGNDRYSIKDEYEAKKKAIKDHIALRKEQANKEISELQRVTKMSKEELKKEADARKDFVKKVNDLQKQLVDALKEKYKEEEKLQEESLNKEIENLDSWKEESQKRIEEVYDSKIKAIEEATKAQEKALNAEIEMMDREDKLEEREEKETDDLAKIKSLQERIEFEHNEFNKEELKKELANVQAEREKRLRQEAREDKKEDLKKQIDDLKENSDKKKEKLEQEKKYEISRLEQLYKAQKQNLQKRLNDVKTFFAEKTKEARLQAEAEKLIMDNNQKEIVSLLHSYEKDYELAGQSLGERLVNGFKPAIDSIKSMIDGLAKQLAELKAEAGGSVSSLSSISRGTSSNSYNTHNSNTVINNNYSATINSPVARTPAQERRAYESTMRRLAFEMR